MTPKFVTVLAALAIGSIAPAALAQRMIIGGDLMLSSGLEGGDPGTGTMLFRRARSRISLGIDLAVDEDPNGIFAIRPFAEVEPHASFGAEIRYGRRIGKMFVPFAGASVLLAPNTLLGAVAGFQVHFPIGQSSLFIEPSFSAMPFGSDMPNQSVLLWFLVSVGFRTTVYNPPPGE